ncbi:P-loop NTPase family protein [Stieleria varia]|uniref:Nickel transporter ATP-binding protein NikE n=1 Tax=Stieleria varia TaxID=2528005 RepID=A0A5C6B0I1_9BACT|nr:hypothetical protein [Stieleria varia]TWU04902.1 nickel transporter ATP-binding protein NikE [Stieleria varia]
MSEANSETIAEPATATLQFRDVTFFGSGETSLRMQNFSASIGSGELVEVSLDRNHDPRDLASAILGLEPLDSGTILFMGGDWLGKDYDRHFRMRSQIGRVFAGSAWVQNLTVRDNLVLSQVHHGVLETDVESEIGKWMQRLSGDQVDLVGRALSNRPSIVEPSLLQICQLIRAVSGRPRLLILERPLQFVFVARFKDFVSVIDELRSNGTAVLFFAGDRDDHSLSFAQPVTHWRIINNRLTSEGAN